MKILDNIEKHYNGILSEPKITHSMLLAPIRQ